MSLIIVENETILQIGETKITGKDVQDLIDYKNYTESPEFIDNIATAFIQTTKTQKGAVVNEKK